MHLIRAREDAFGQLAAAETARNQFQRDIIPATPGGGPGVASAPAPPPVRSRSDLIADTNVVAGVLASNFPWMYAKPKDEKGETKQKETAIEKAEDQIEGIENQTKEVEKGNSFLGKLVKWGISILALWTLFGKDVKGMFSGLGGGIWDNIKWLGGWIWEKVKWLGEKIWEGLKWLWDEYLWPFLEPIWNSIKDKVMWVGKVLSNVGQNIMSGLQWVAIKIATGIDRVWSILKFIGTKGLSSLAKSIVMGFVDKSKSAAFKFISGIGKGIYSTWDHTGGRLVNAAKGEGFKRGGTREAYDKLVDPIQERLDARADMTLGDRMGEYYSEFEREQGLGPMQTALYKSGMVDPKIDPTAKHFISPDIKFVPILPEDDPITDKVTGMAKKIGDTVSDAIPDSIKKATAEAVGATKETYNFLQDRERVKHSMKSMHWSDIREGKYASRVKEGGHHIYEKVAEITAKPLNTYLPTILKADEDNVKVLKESEKLLQRIEQNTRGGGSVAVVPGQRGGTSTGSSKASPAQPNINMAPGGKKLDARGGYVPSAYAILPNTLTE